MNALIFFSVVISITSKMDMTELFTFLLMVALVQTFLISWLVVKIL